jgi:hypothetical protein
MEWQSVDSAAQRRRQLRVKLVDGQYANQPKGAIVWDRKRGLSRLGRVQVVGHSASSCSVTRPGVMTV